MQRLRELGSAHPELLSHDRIASWEADLHCCRPLNAAALRAVQPGWGGPALLEGLGAALRRVRPRGRGRGADMARAVEAQWR